MTATAFDLGKDHPNSPSFDESAVDPDLYVTSEADRIEAARRLIAERAERDAEALARIDALMRPLREWEARSAIWDRAAEALKRHDYAAYDKAMAEFNSPLADAVVEVVRKSRD